MAHPVIECKEETIMYNPTYLILHVPPAMEAIYQNNAET